MVQSEIQIGKNKITENFLKTLKDHFKKHENVRVSVLKNAGHTKQDVKNYSKEILNHLGENYTSKTLGFKIFIKKWRGKKKRI